MPREFVQIQRCDHKCYVSSLLLSFGQFLLSITFYKKNTVFYLVLNIHNRIKSLNIQLSNRTQYSTSSIADNTSGIF
jgi:hypothetical protein